MCLYKHCFYTYNIVHLRLFFCSLIKIIVPTVNEQTHLNGYDNVTNNIEKTILTVFLYINSYKIDEQPNTT